MALDVSRFPDTTAAHHLRTLPASRPSPSQDAESSATTTKHKPPAHHHRKRGFPINIFRKHELVADEYHRPRVQSFRPHAREFVMLPVGAGSGSGERLLRAHSNSALSSRGKQMPVLPHLEIPDSHLGISFASIPAPEASTQRDGMEREKEKAELIFPPTPIHPFTSTRETIKVLGLVQGAGAGSGTGMAIRTGEVCDAAFRSTVGSRKLGLTLLPAATLPFPSSSTVITTGSSTKLRPLPPIPTTKLCNAVPTISTSSCRPHTLARTRSEGFSPTHTNKHVHTPSMPITSQEGVNAPPHAWRRLPSLPLPFAPKSEGKIILVACASPQAEAGESAHARGTPALPYLLLLPPTPRHEHAQDHSHNSQQQGEEPLHVTVDAGENLHYASGSMLPCPFPNPEQVPTFSTVNPHSSLPSKCTSSAASLQTLASFLPPRPPKSHLRAQLKPQRRGGPRDGNEGAVWAPPDCWSGPSSRATSPSPGEEERINLKQDARGFFSRGKSASAQQDMQPNLSASSLHSNVVDVVLSRDDERQRSASGSATPSRSQSRHGSEKSFAESRWTGDVLVTKNHPSKGPEVWEVLEVREILSELRHLKAT